MQMLQNFAERHPIVIFKFYCCCWVGFGRLYSLIQSCLGVCPELDCERIYRVAASGSGVSNSLWVRGAINCVVMNKGS